MNVSVLPIYTLANDKALANSCAVVIDTLRMTSVAVTALQNGCAGIRVVSEIDQATALARQYNALLGGERNALRIDGFDFANSPLEYTREKISGRRLVMTTTNGTRAISAVMAAQDIYLACLLNAQAAAQAISQHDNVTMVLAGTAGKFSLEDAVTAGAILSHLCIKPQDDMAQACLALWSYARGDIAGFLATVPHVQRLRGLGLQADLDYCLTPDTTDTVPHLGSDGWFTAN